jgi:hypothetical protein
MLNMFVNQKTNIQILKWVFVIGVFFMTFFGFFVKNRWLFWHFLYIVKTKIRFKEIKTRGKQIW